MVSHAVAWTFRAERESYFKATTDFDEGLQRTIKWYLEQAEEWSSGMGRRVSIA